MTAYECFCPSKHKKFYQRSCLTQSFLNDLHLRRFVHIAWNAPILTHACKMRKPAPMNICRRNRIWKRIPSTGSIPLPRLRNGRSPRSVNLDGTATSIECCKMHIRIETRCTPCTRNTRHQSFQDLADQMPFFEPENAAERVEEISDFGAEG